MSNAAFYDSIERANAEPLARGELDTDPYLNGELADSRRCVSVVVPIVACAETYRRFVRERLGFLIGQYVYPDQDLHITVFDFTDARSGYERDPARERLFVEAFASAASNLTIFELNLHGTVFTRNAAIVRVLDAERRIQTLRTAVRARAQELGLPNHERFKSESAHVSFLRWRTVPHELATFHEQVKRAKDYDFGTETVRTLELVEHDWYNRGATRRVLSRLDLQR